MIEPRGHAKACKKNKLPNCSARITTCRYRHLHASPPARTAIHLSFAYHTSILRLRTYKCLTMNSFELPYSLALYGTSSILVVSLRNLKRYITQIGNFHRGSTYLRGIVRLRTVLQWIVFKRNECGVQGGLGTSS